MCITCPDIVPGFLIRLSVALLLVHPKAFKCVETLLCASQIPLLQPSVCVFSLLMVSFDEFGLLVVFFMVNGFFKNFFRGPAGTAPSCCRMVGGGAKHRLCGEGPQCEKLVNVKKSKSYEADVPSDLRKEVESHYRLLLPEDFYHFWRFCKGLDPEQPADSLSASLGLRLVGPYDILAGKHKIKKKSASLNFNLHWRFYYDPPEFQTIIIGDSKTQFHMGYFRDSPDELPVFVGTNEAKKNCIIVQSGDNVFAAVK